MPKTEDAVDFFTKLSELRVLKIISVLVSDCIFWPGVWCHVLSWDKQWNEQYQLSFRTKFAKDAIEDHYQAGAWKAPTTSPCVESKCIDAPVVSNAVGLQVRNTGTWRATWGRGWAYFLGNQDSRFLSMNRGYGSKVLEHPLDHPLKMTNLVVLPALIRSNTSSYLHWVWQWYGR